MSNLLLSLQKNWKALNEFHSSNHFKQLSVYEQFERLNIDRMDSSSCFIFPDVRPRALAITELVVPIFLNENRLACTSAYCTFLMTTDEKIFRNERRYYQAFITAVCSLCDWRDSMIDNLKEATNENQTKIDLKLIRTNADVQSFIDYCKVEMPGFIYELAKVTEEEMENTSISLAKIGTYILLMCKSAKTFQPQFFELCKSLNYNNRGEQLEWNIKNSVGAHTAIAAEFKLRSQLFKYLYAQSNTSHRFKPFYQTIMNYFMWTNLGHIRLILEYLNPESVVLSLVRIHNCEKTLFEAFDFLVKMGNDAPYARLLRDQNECKPILKTTVSTYAQAALAIARYKEPTRYMMYAHINTKYIPTINLKIKDFLVACHRNTKTVLSRSDIPKAYEFKKFLHFYKYK